MKLWTAHVNCHEHTLLTTWFDEEPLLPNGKRAMLLDVGCSESDLCHTTAELGWEVYGVDLNPYLVSMPIRRRQTVAFPDGVNRDIDIMQLVPGVYFTIPDKTWTFLRGDFLNPSETPLPPRGFDVVIANSSIEHFGLKSPYMPDLELEDDAADVSAYQRIGQVLKSGGVFYLVTHAHNWDKIFDWSRCYSEEGLRTRLAQAGLVIEIMAGYCFHPHVQDSWDNLRKQIPARNRYEIARGNIEQFRVVDHVFPESQFASNTWFVKARKP